MTTRQRRRHGSRSRVAGCQSPAAAVVSVQALLSVLLAPSCLACCTLLDRPLDGPVCAACWRSVAPLSPPLCRRCGDVLPSWRAIDRLGGLLRPLPAPPAGRRLRRAAGAYEGALRAVVHALKYERRRTLAAPAGGADARARRRGPGGRRLRRAGAAALAPPARARIQPGGRPGPRPGTAGRPRAAARAADGTAVRPDAGAAGCGTCGQPSRRRAAAGAGAGATTRGCAAPAWCWWTTCARPARR